MRYNNQNTPGYSDTGLRSLTRAHAIIVDEHGYDMECLPDHVTTEINQSIRDRLTNTHGRNLSVKMLLALAS